jgi:hypothetical protein
LFKKTDAEWKRKNKHQWTKIPSLDKDIVQGLKGIDRADAYICTMLMLVPADYWNPRMSRDLTYLCHENRVFPILNQVMGVTEPGREEQAKIKAMWLFAKYVVKPRGGDHEEFDSQDEISADEASDVVAYQLTTPETSETEDDTEADSGSETEESKDEENDRRTADTRDTISGFESFDASEHEPETEPKGDTDRASDEATVVDLSEDDPGLDVLRVRAQAPRGKNDKEKKRVAFDTVTSTPKAKSRTDPGKKTTHGAEES